MFENEDSVNLTSDGTQKLRDAAQRARAQGNCPRAKFTVVVKKGDPTFQGALAKARRDALLSVLGDQARYFVFETDDTGAKSDVQVDYSVSRDTIAPALNVTWTPPKNSKVKPRDRIMAKVIARDDANRWQTGIKTIDLDVQGGGSFGFEDYPQPPQTCESPPPAQTLEGVYTVPANPPPVVRLRARTSDFAGHSAQDIAEFPTAGDWYGTLDLSFITPAYRNHAHLDITIDYDRRGNLTGQIWEGKVSAEKTAGMACTLAVVSPAMLSATLVGQYTPGTSTMSLTMRDEKAVMGQFVCPPVPGGIDYGHGLLSEPKLAELLRSFTTKDDGSVDETRTDTTVPQNHVTIKLKLHRVQK